MRGGVQKLFGQCPNARNAIYNGASLRLVGPQGLVCGSPTRCGPDHVSRADRATSPDGSICSKHLSGASVCYGSRIPGPWGQVGPDRVENLKYLSGTGVRSRSKKLSGAGVPPKEKKKLSLERTTCLADKTNHPVERLSLNRSQCGSCSTKYDTSAGT